MAELPPHVLRLLEEARQADDPSAEDRRRVHSALMAGLGIAAGTGVASVAGEAAAHAGGHVGAHVGSHVGSHVAAEIAAHAGAQTAGTAAAGAAGTGVGAVVSSVALKWGAAVVVAALGTSVMVAEPWAPAEAPPAPIAAPANPALSPVGASTLEPVVEAAGEPVVEAAGEPVVEAAAAANTAEALRARDPSRTVRTRAVGAQLAAPRKQRARETVVAVLAEPPEAVAQQPDAQRVAPLASTGEPEASVALPSSRQELALIQRATRDLNRGELVHAMSTLSEHGRRFPGGVLVEERQALRVMTLCKLGRVAEGRVERDRFLATRPASPLAERVRSACDTPDP